MTLRTSLYSSCALALLCGATACSGASTAHVTSGGASSTQPAGGGSSAGGAGSIATGGAAATGGSTSAGGTSSTGGTKAAGGTTSTGGTANASTSTGGVVTSPGCGNSSLPAACNTTTTGPCTITVNGLSRQYFVVLPTNYDANTPYPVVYAWHYRGGTAAGLLSGYPGAFYGVKTGFPNAIYVAGQGLDSGTGDSGTDYGWPNTNGQDVNFAKALVTWVNGNFCVDESRLFATGMSYGGMMSNTLGCQMPDVFRAIGVMSGALFTGYGQTCVNHPIAAWFTHGDADTTVAISGDITARDQFIKDNGCDTTNTQSVVLDTNTTCTIYNSCTAGNYPVVWCPVVGEGHTIPSWAGAEIAKFFLQF
jgi:polyhydroxybutyrate depolymerase